MKPTKTVNIDAFHAELKGDTLTIWGKRGNDNNYKIHVRMEGNYWLNYIPELFKKEIKRRIFEMKTALERIRS